MNPKTILAMAAYIDAADRLAEATDDLLRAIPFEQAGMISSLSQFETVAHNRRVLYIEARRQWEEASK